MIGWTLQDQLDWELLREAPEALAAEAAVRRPDLVAQRERTAAEIRAYLEAQGRLA